MSDVVDPDGLKASILGQLSKVIDPETGVDVVRMRLVEDLVVDAHGCVAYKFRPSSVLCPLAIPLSLAIYKAVAEVDGVSDQELRVVGHVLAPEITELVRESGLVDPPEGKVPLER